MEAQEVIGNFAQIALPLVLAAFINETYKGLIAGLTPARREYMEISTWLSKTSERVGVTDDVLAQLEDRQSRLGARLKKETHIPWTIAIPLLMMIVGLIALVSANYVQPDRIELQFWLSTAGGLLGALGAAVAALGAAVGRPRKKRV
jgi:hypothetical protein